MSEEKKDLGEEIAGKILAAALVLAGAYAFFQVVVRGIFSLMMGGNPDKNGIYVLFYGGIVVLAVIFLLGAGSGFWLWRRAKAKPAGAERPSVFSRGITIGLVVVVLIAVFVIGGFLHGF